MNHFFKASLYQFFEKKNKFLLLVFPLLLSLTFPELKAQNQLWKITTIDNNRTANDLMPQLPQVENRTLYELSIDRMITRTDIAPNEQNLTLAISAAIISLPLPNGSFQDFKVWESSIMEAGLQAKYPEIKTYLIRGVDDTYAVGRMMVSPYEFSAYFSSPISNQEVFVRKVYKGITSTYVSYSGKDAPINEDWVCDYIPTEDLNENNPTNRSNNGYDTGTELWLFRLAIGFPGATSQSNNYTTKAEALAGIVSFLSEINAVYERDMSMRFVLPANQDEIIFLDDATDPYTTNGGDLSIYENRTILQQYIGDENYDLGFVFVLGGCCGARGDVCTDEKEVSMNEFRDLPVTCHEIGHQFDARHVQSYCGGPRAGNELGSGTTIMSYNGICGADNIPEPGDLNYFGILSREQMINFRTDHVSCGQVLATGNTPPTITVPADGFYIPKETPFKLIGSGSDAEGDILTYSWEQSDFINGGLPVATEPTSGNGDVPIQRPYNPVTSPERIIPRIDLILDNQTSIYERLPTYTRGMKYTLLTRDNHPGAGGTTYSEVSFNVDGTAGPFLVSSQNSCASYAAGSMQTITWDVANTDNANVNAQTVNIELSIDGGYTWEYTLASSTANDGTESVTLPANICTNRARIKVEAVGSDYTFFDINNADLSIEDGNTVTTPSALVLDGEDDAVEINTTVGNFGTGDFTVEMYVKTSLKGGYIISKRPTCDGVNSFWEINIEPDGKVTISLFQGTGGPNNSLTSTSDIADGAWHHLAFTRDNGTVKIFVDGTEENSGTLSANLSNATILTIGHNICNDFGATRFKGEITEFRLWNRAFADFNNAACRIAGTETGLEVYYPFNLLTCGGCVTSAVADATANNNNGTLLGEAITTVSTADIEECPTCTNGNITLNTHPSNTSVADGAMATFSVSATGTNISYQWAISTDGGTTYNQIDGANSDTYSFTASSFQNGNQYICYLVNGCDVQTTNAATLTVSCSALSLSSITGPTAPCQDNYYTYYVSPNPDVATWSWTAPAGWMLIPFDNMIFVQVGATSGNIEVMATDACGNTDSKTLAVTPTLIEITTHPSSQTVNENTAVTMTVAVNSGGGATDYFWQQSADGGMTYTDIDNSNTASYNFTATIGHDDRLYRCIVENDCLRDTSNVATLTVNCVNSIPEITTAIIGMDRVCGSATLTFAIAPVPGAATYNWTLPAGWSGTSTTNQINVTTDGSGGDVTVSATNSCGTSAVETLTVAQGSNDCEHVIHFDGVDDYVTAAQNGQYLNDDLTVSFWVAPDRINGLQSLVFNGTEFEIALQDGRIVYRHSIYGGSYTDSVDSTFTHTPLQIGIWNFIALTRDVSERTLKLYINGFLVETKVWTTDYPSTPDDNTHYPLTFGAGANGLITFFKGKLDKVKIWQEVRTNSQILDEACQSAGTGANLLADYDFQQGQPYGDNTGVSSLSNSVSTFPAATPMNMTLNGISSNILSASLNLPLYEDKDNDGFGGQTPWTCGSGHAYVANADDCDDDNVDINPSAIEICGNGIDDNCDGQTDVLFNNGLDFGGAGHQLTTPNIVYSNSFTYETWVKMSSADLGERFFLAEWAGSGIGGSFQIIPSGHVGYHEGGGASFGDVIVDNAWHHIALVRNGNNVKIYIDGVERYSNNFNNTINNTSLIFGRDSKGQMDEICYWNYPLSEIEINKRMSVPLKGDETGLVRYYSLNQGTPSGTNSIQTSVIDLSSNAAHGTLTGFALSGNTSNFVAGHPYETLYVDADSDGFGSSEMWSCSSDASVATNSYDDNDFNADINPNKVEVCGNGIDDNGNGVIDEKTLSLDFSGSNDEVVVNNTLGNFGTEDLTIEARVKMNTVGSTSYLFAKAEVCGCVNGWFLEKRADDKLQFVLRNVDCGGQTFMTGNTVLSSGTWYHIAIVKEGTSFRLYVDGQLDVSMTSSHATNNNGNLIIGGSLCNFEFDGEIDEFRYWNKALSAEEVDLYKDSFLPINHPDLETYYDFNNPAADPGQDNSGLTTLTDRKGNHDGTLTNFTLNGNTSNWIGNPSYSCSDCAITPALTNDGPACAGENITFTATPASEASYHFFADANLNGMVDGGESLQNNGSDTYVTNSLNDGDIISVLVGSCTNAAASTVSIDDAPTLMITNPTAICPPATADLTQADVTAGSDAGTLAYYTDASLTTTVSDPMAVTVGTYYIKLTGTNGCSSSAAVLVDTDSGCNASTGRALAYDGNGDIVEIPDHPDLDLTTVVSLEAWVNPSAYVGYAIIVMKANHGGWSNGYGLTIDSDNTLDFHPNYWGSRLKTTYTLPLNQWTHVAGTFDGTTARVYINGVLHSSKAMSSGIPVNTNVLEIGGDVGIPSYSFSGLIDEVRVWNRTLTEAEIQESMNCEAPQDNTGLVANYDFNNGDAGGDNSNPAVTNLDDVSGNGHHGLLKNFALTGTESNWVAPGGAALTCAPRPEIDVLGGLTPVSIENGDTSPDVSDGTDFGPQTVNSDTDHTFVISNTGNEILNLTGNPIVTLTDDGNGTFSVLTQPANNSIAIGGADLNFVIRFTPNAEGRYTGTVSIANDDNDENPYTFDITGVTPGCDINIDELVVTNADCGGNNGMVTINASCNSCTLEYSMNGTNYQPGNTFGGLIAGTYTVYVRNSAEPSCPISAPLVISESCGFITTWEVTGTTAQDLTITIPTSSGTYDYAVDWGDNTFTTGHTGAASHTYAQAGTYTVQITGTFPQIYFWNSTHREKIKSIEQWGDISWNSFYYSFYNCTNLEYNATDAPDLSNVSSMVFAFYNNTSFDGDLSSWNIENVTDMTQMLSLSGMSPTNYDNLLIGWAAQTVQNNVPLGAQNLRYCAGENARTTLTGAGWNITGDSKQCPEDAFITTWEVTAGDLTIQIPIYGSSLYIDWGDDNITPSSGSLPSHTYVAAGTYEVTIYGTNNFYIYFAWRDGKDEIKTIEQWGSNTWTFMNYAFAGCSNLTLNATDIPDLSNITTMYSTFADATSFNGDLSGWDVSNVTNMYNTFKGATSFNGDLSGWNVSNVTSMYGMFSGATSFNQSLNGWETNPNSTVGNVTNMSNMFRGASSFNGDISMWDVSSVTNTSSMFQEASSFNQDISVWETTSLTYLIYMFFNASSFDQNIGGWDITNLQYTYALWQTLMGTNISTDNYDNILIGWEMQEVPDNIYLNTDLKYCVGQEARKNLITDHNWYFIGDSRDRDLCPGLPFQTKWNIATNGEEIHIYTNQYLDYDFDIDWGDNSPVETNVTGTISHTYQNAGQYTVSITGNFPHFLAANYWSDPVNARKIIEIVQWGDIEWENMYGAFGYAENVQSTALDAPDLFKVYSTAYMFYNAKQFNSNLNNWDMSKVHYTYGMFMYASNFNGAINKWDVSNVTYMSSMFAYATSFNQPLFLWETDKVRYMRNMFNGATNFDQDLSDWDFTGLEANYYSPLGYAFNNSGLSVSNYDNLLTKLALQAPNMPSGLTMDASNLKYCLAENDRNTLINTYSWVINDAGLDGGCPFAPDNPDALTFSPSNMPFDFEVFPNPTRHQLSVTLNTENFINETLSITDITGKIVYQQQLEAEQQQLTINLADKGITTGIYQLSIRHSEGVLTKKVVVER